ncbi:Predicted arabinose efflux permease, MFS family [Halobaculum gomorrense]|uniref:Predicted arabinose efflux permease, MFS family n=1 Tax=Halobaculum gomorrense TaxID=43928 RepID=A0A1M5RA54_9EURY|nr:Predicted arabinose efflux permease, MFS family [Halobaculum gomorrense]
MSLSLDRLVGDDADVLADRDFRMLLLASLISPMGASVVSPVVESLTGPYGVSTAEAALLLSAFTAPGIVLIPLSGVLADRYGRKPVLVSGLALFGLAGVALTLTTDFRVALGLRLLQGVGYTGIGPILITATGDLFSGARESAAQGVRFTAVGASLTVFPFLAGLLVAFAWQYPFALYAAALPVAAVVWLRFEEPAALGQGDTADGDASATDGDAAGSGGERGDGRGGVRTLLALASDPRVAATLVGRAVPGFLWFGFLTYNSIVVVRLLGGTPSAAGALVAVASVSSAVATTQAGRITARFGRPAPTFAALVVAAGGLAGLALAPSVPVALAAGVPVGAGFSVSLTLYRSALTGLASDDTRGGLVSLGESIGRLGSTGAPVAMGAAVALLADAAGYAAAVRTVSVAVAVGVVAVGGTLLLVGDMGVDADGEPTATAAND